MKQYLLLSLLLLSLPFAMAQVGVGTDDPTATLDIRATNTTTPANDEGILIPRIDEFPAVNPTLDQDAMMVFVTGAGSPARGFYYWDNTNTSWVAIGGAGSTDDQNLETATLTGNNLTLAIENGNPTSVDLSALVNDADAVIGNEYNTDFSLLSNNLSLTDGGGTRTVNLAPFQESAQNGLSMNGNFVELGGTLLRNTLIEQGDFTTVFNLDATGDFHIQDAGVNQFSVLDNGDVNANNATLFVDANTNQVGIGTAAPGSKLHVVGDILLTGGVRNIEGQLGDRNIQLDDANPNWNGDVYGGVTRFFGDGNLAGSKLEAGGLQLERRIQIMGGNPAVGRVLTSDALGNASWQDMNFTASNGLNMNAGEVRLGGGLIQETTITNNTFGLNINLNSTGDFNVQDNGIDHFTILDVGTTRFGGDVEWRDESTVGTLLAQLFDDGNDGRFALLENGVISVDLDANTQFIFNEQGLDRNFRIESVANPNLFVTDAGLNRVSIGTNTSAGEFNVLGTSYHSDDIFLRDGAINGGDILVRIYDSDDDGLISVYTDNLVNHTINGNGPTVFNDQGIANGDVRMESDTRTHMFWLDPDENLVRFGTANVGSDNANGSLIDGVLVDYVVDFDRGIGADGTAIGIGSIEFILDGNGETLINSPISPTTHLNRDLGFSTTQRAWDDVFADNFVNVSDLREKSNVQNLNYGLEEVLALRPVSYTLQRDPFKETKLGLIAQEALALIPESVKTHDHKVLDESNPETYTKVKMDRMGMKYNYLIPVLIKATQEQQEIINTQQEQIDRLTQLVEDLIQAKD
ncbi:tail fiber domain-containing protein [Nonlabens xiamenensis]|uniref:tail fiber domain-containing protein n=1 Tax=Nonlabens xiamenensis TaxID=2341043 RepID=UPI000F609E0E|nr:tail fiber domain-containing protein [Nonlabens xiamenensis]